MAESEPGRVFQYNIPADQTPARSSEVRENFRALMRNQYTTDPAHPASPQEHEFRLLDDHTTPALTGNLRLQVYLGGTWREVLQNLQLGFAAPSKVVSAAFNAVALNPWVVDHNLGSKPVVQVFDSSWNQLRVVRDTHQRREFLGWVNTALLIPGPVRVGMVLPYPGTLLSTELFVADFISAGAGVVFDFVLAGTPLTPSGDIIIPGAVPRGALLPGNPIPGAAGVFAAGAALDINVNVAVPPPDGAVELWGIFDRTLAPDECRVQHITDNRFEVRFAAATTGFLVYVG